MQSEIDQAFDNIEKGKYGRELGNIVDQITHFFDKRPNTLQVEHNLPEMDRGYPKDGNITIRLIKDKGSQAFKLNVGEAMRFANVIIDLCELHRTETKKLWDRRKNESQHSS